MSFILRSIVRTADIKIRECVKWCLQEVKNNGRSLNFQVQKVVAVPRRRWSLTRSFNCEALTGKVLVFRISVRLWEVITYERWSHMEVRLYYDKVFHQISIHFHPLCYS